MTGDATDQRAPLHDAHDLVAIHTVAPIDLEALAPVLAQRLVETVDGGTPMGFLPPLARSDATDYFRSLLPELRANTRVLLVAFSGGRLVASGQLLLSPWANSPHRAELQKVFVSAALRGRGIGRALMQALHATARQHGRSLLVLNTRLGDASQSFYRAFGYREAGIIPGWTIGAAGERHDHVTMYRELPTVRERRERRPPAER